MFNLSRLAPTPSGWLHEGNGLSFILTWALARRHQARLLLRVDDLDRARYRPAYLEDIFETLVWLGLDYDQGPRSEEDLERHWSQRHRMNLYLELLAVLRESGRLYACVCSRSRRRLLTANASCPCREEGISLDRQDASWKVQVPEGTRVACREPGGLRHLDIHQLMGDFVVRQKNGMPAYQVASLADDRHFGVDLIVRGEDLLPSTAAQLYLASLTGYADFLDAVFVHHPLVLDAQGQKLSKSGGARALRSWRDEGHSPHHLIARVGELLSLPHRPHTLQELIDCR
jgi:glutamyl/glutaminyl-tRNA synthetase